MLGLQAKMRKYQGADYDGTPLEEAKDLVKQSELAVRRPAEARKRKSGWRGRQAQLNQEIATRDYRMAEYYDQKERLRRGQTSTTPRSSRSIRTPSWLRKSRERVAEINGEPDDPPKTLGVPRRPVPRKPRADAASREFPNCKTAARGWPRRRSQHADQAKARSRSQRP